MQPGSCKRTDGGGKLTGVATLAMELLERRPPAPSPCHDPVRNGKVKLTIVDFRKLTIVDFNQLTEKSRTKRRSNFQTKSLHETSKVARIEGDIPHARPACPSRTPAIAPRPPSTCCPRLPTDQPARAAPADTSAPGTAQHYPSPSSRIRPPSPLKEGPTKCRTAAPRTEQSNTQATRPDPTTLAHKPESCSL